MKITKEITFTQAKVALAKIGMTLTKKDGEFRVNFKGGHEETAYYTSDVVDALNTGRVMSHRGV